jgi:hypothetical protein
MPGHFSVAINNLSLVLPLTRKLTDVKTTDPARI